MCDVCVAEGALRREGIRITWDEAPKTAKAVLLFADGIAEGPATYKMHLDGEKLDADAPGNYTDDLALVCMRYGLDIRWRCVPRVVQDWVLGKRDRPTMVEVIKSRAQRNGRRSRTWQERVADTLAWHLEFKSDAGAMKVRRIPRSEIERVFKLALKKYDAWLKVVGKPPKKVNPKGYRSRLLNNPRVYDRAPAKA